MGRLIDADRLKAHYCWWAGGSKEMSIDEAKKTFDTIIDIQPTVDAEPVVRCKDCKYWCNNDCQNDSHGYCPINENDFCSHRERREEPSDKEFTLYADDKPIVTFKDSKIVLHGERREDD